MIVKKERRSWKKQTPANMMSTCPFHFFFRVCALARVIVLLANWYYFIFLFMRRRQYKFHFITYRTRSLSVAHNKLGAVLVVCALCGQQFIRSKNWTEEESKKKTLRSQTKSIGRSVSSGAWVFVCEATWIKLSTKQRTKNQTNYSQ